MIKTELQFFDFGDLHITLVVPNKQDLFYQYKTAFPFQPFPDTALKNNYPYWAKVWHSSVALSKYMVTNPHLIQHKKVLELAAGLGLCSMVAATLATQVICSDYAQDAIPYIKQTILANQLQNVQTALIDWEAIPPHFDFDVLLLSDVNYDANQFAILYDVLEAHLQNHKTIILATPQRLMAKPFIEKLLPFCVDHQELEIVMEEETAFINVLLLQL
jgi:methyltransferase-like protein 23